MYCRGGSEVKPKKTVPTQLVDGLMIKGTSRRVRVRISYLLFIFKKYFTVRLFALGFDNLFEFIG